MNRPEDPEVVGYILAKGRTTAFRAAALSRLVGDTPPAGDDSSGAAGVVSPCPTLLVDRRGAA
jgi:hypothetical protein